MDLQGFVDGLSAGQVGCLDTGNYDVRPGELWFRRPAVSLRSVPGGRARIIGRIVVAANDVTIENLTLDGLNQASGGTLPSPTVNGSDDRFVADDVTDEHTGICFDIDNYEGPTPQDTLITHNRIHGCGSIPSTNEDHGIYVAEAKATRITDNLIYNNVDRGIQLYPDAQGTLIENNVIWGNGENIIFSGNDGLASSHTRVTGNLIGGSRIRANVEYYYPAGNLVGVENRVTRNCIYGRARDSPSDPGGISDQIGFRAYANLLTRPRLRARKGQLAMLHARARACPYVNAGTLP